MCCTRLFHVESVSAPTHHGVCRRERTVTAVRPSFAPLCRALPRLPRFTLFCPALPLLALDFRALLARCVCARLSPLRACACVLRSPTTTSWLPPLPSGPCSGPGSRTCPRPCPSGPSSGRSGCTPTCSTPRLCTLATPRRTESPPPLVPCASAPNALGSGVPSVCRCACLFGCVNGGSVSGWRCLRRRPLPFLAPSSLPPSRYSCLLFFFFLQVSV